MVKQLKFTTSAQTRYSNALHINYHNALYATISSLPAPDLTAWRIQPLLSDWRASIDMENDISRETQSSRETLNLEQLDQQRDRIITYLFTIIKAERTCGILPARQEAGRHLSLVTKTYSRIQIEAYKEQTASTNGLITDLQKAENFQDLKTLGLDAYVSQLKQINDEFQQRMLTRTVTKAQTQLPTAKAQRKVSDTTLSTIMERIQGIFHFVDTDAERERINFLVTLINKINDEYRARYNQATGQTGGTSGNTTPPVINGGYDREPTSKAEGE